MLRSPLPKVAIGWGIAALRRQVDEIEQGARALQTLKHDDDLSEQIAQAYQAMVDDVHRLRSALTRLEDMARQAGIPLDHA